MQTLEPSDLLNYSEPFEDMRPYKDEEINNAMLRLTESPYFPMLSQFIFPEKQVENVRQQLRGFHTIKEFQEGVMWYVNCRIIEMTTDGFTCEGAELLSPDESYLYVSNHRDIMLDASLLQNALHAAGLPTSQITFGENLMQGQEVIDIGKSNKMFRVLRPQGNSPRDFYQASLLLSQYLRHVITELHESAWIAQRNGRTKNGIDGTDQGIIKMFSMALRKNEVKALADLHIVPVAVSYEWEPCDYLKALELYDREQNDGKYEKKPGEDLNSILTGIKQQKGRVHFQICPPLTLEELQQIEESQGSGAFHRAVASLIDDRIRKGYHHFDRDKQDFQKRIDTLMTMAGNRDKSRLKEIFVSIYTNSEK